MPVIRSSCVSPAARIISIGVHRGQAAREKPSTKSSSLSVGEAPGSHNSDTSVPRLRWRILRKERAVIYYRGHRQRNTHPDLKAMPRSFQYSPCPLIVTQQQLCISVMGQRVGLTAEVMSRCGFGPCKCVSVLCVCHSGVSALSVCFLCVRALCLCHLCVSAVCVSFLFQRAVCVCFLGVSGFLCIPYVSARSVCVFCVSAGSVCVLCVSARRLCVIFVSACSPCVSFGCRSALCVCHWCVDPLCLCHLCVSATSVCSLCQHSLCPICVLACSLCVPFECHLCVSVLVKSTA